MPTDLGKHRLLIARMSSMVTTSNIAFSLFYWIWSYVDVIWASSPFHDMINIIEAICSVASIRLRTHVVKITLNGTFKSLGKRLCRDLISYCTTESICRSPSYVSTSADLGCMWFWPQNSAQFYIWDSA